jgi:hypothetical protein
MDRTISALSVAFSFDVGTVVTYCLHDKTTAGWKGVIVAREFYEDAQGKRLWYHVRWMDPHGKISEDLLRHSLHEITPL